MSLKMDSNSPRRMRTLPEILADRKIRGWISQVLVLGGVLFLFYFVATNAANNMAKLGITSGFGFLQNAAGFDVSMSLIPYDLTDTHARVFIVGALNTLLVSLLGVIAATLLGVVVGVSRLSSNWLVAKVSLVYIEVFRNLPLLFQILFWYGLVLLWPKVRNSISIGEVIFINNRGVEIPVPLFEAGAVYVGISAIVGFIAFLAARKWAGQKLDQTGKSLPIRWIGVGLIIGLPLIVALGLGWPWTWDIPARTGFNYSGGLSISTALIALWFSLTVYTASFIAENVRSGILSVAKGQSEAAASLGLAPGPTMRLIILPQALRVIVPPLISQYLNLIKNSSLAVAIGYPDLVNVFSGTSLNQTGQAIEVILMTMAFYLSISLLISFGMNIYNKRIALRGGAV